MLLLCKVKETKLIGAVPDISTALEAIPLANIPTGILIAGIVIIVSTT